MELLEVHLCLAMLDLFIIRAGINMFLKCLQVLFLFSIIAGSLGCAPNVVSEDLELTYEEYCERHAKREFDPIGAKLINSKGYSPRDGYDYWWKLEISKEDWLGIINQIGLGEPRSYFPDSQDGNVFGIPNTWPEADIPFPEWWIPSDDFGTWIITFQEQEKEGKRARGWYWLYDEPSLTAIGWHWNNQYVWFQPKNNYSINGPAQQGVQNLSLELVPSGKKVSE